jgi:hypothetical protein
VWDAGWSRGGCRLVTWGMQAGNVGDAGWSRGECRLVTWRVKRLVTWGVQAGHVEGAGKSRGGAGWSNGECFTWGVEVHGYAGSADLSRLVLQNSHAGNKSWSRRN